MHCRKGDDEMSHDLWIMIVILSLAIYLRTNRIYTI